MCTVSCAHRWRVCCCGASRILCHPSYFFPPFFSARCTHSYCTCTYMNICMDSIHIRMYYALLYDHPMALGCEVNTQNQRPPLVFYAIVCEWAVGERAPLWVDFFMRKRATSNEDGWGWGCGVVCSVDDGVCVSVRVVAVQAVFVGTSAHVL